MSDIGWFFRNSLNLRHLRLIVAIDNYRSISRAAAYLHITQPAVSKTLSLIETGLGFKLFARTNAGLEPTEEGACLIETAKDIFESLERCQTSLEMISGGSMGHVSMGVLPASAVHLMPRFVAKLNAETDSILVSIREGTMDRLLPSLKLGELDFAVGLLPDRPLGIEYDAEILMSHPIVAVARKGHPLEGTRDLNWAKVQNYPLILPGPNTFTRAAMDAMLSKNGMRPLVSQVDSVSTMTNIGTLQLTDSIGFFSKGLASHFINLGVLLELELELPDITMDIGLIWVKNKRQTGAQKLARKLLLEAASEIGLEMAV